jgi:hypothetical protein
MKPTEPVERRGWCVEWHSVNKLDGDVRHLCWDNTTEHAFPHLFRTRAECRAHIEAQYGYVTDRPDLWAEPHGWRKPQAVPVLLRIEKLPTLRPKETI